MNLIPVLIQQIIIMYILIFVGAYLYKKNFVTSQGAKEIGAILLNLVVPLIIIQSFCVEKTFEKLQTLGITFLLSFVILGISMVVSSLIFKRDGVANFSVAFSNAGFIGIPLVQSVLGSEAVFNITCLIAFLNLLQWTYGVYVISEHKTRLSLKLFIKNPILIAFLIGICIFFFEIQIPLIAFNTMKMISALNTPLAMLILGIYLAQTPLLSMFSQLRLYLISLVRLIIIPLVTLVILMLLPQEYNEIRLSLLISASAPSGANVAIFAQKYNADYSYAVNIVCLTTLLSIVTLPFIVLLAQ